MGPNRDGEPDEASGISYPSPGGEGLDAGPFYGTSHRDGTQDHHQDGDHQNGDDVHDQGVDQSHLQDADGTSHRPTNLEELQLAAQLGQGLAGTGILPSTDPNMSVDDSGMRNIMPHPDGDHQGSPYVHDTPTSDHMVQHGMQVPVGPPLPPQYSLPDGIPPRKRSKVSRACDECRRKKIKCDAQSDTGDSPCSSCARSSIRCLFSRVPQKRGPSKGYIKELADRIHSIENKLESDGGLSQEEIDRLFGSERQPRGTNGSLPVEEPGRKRPFSSISSAEITTPVANRTAPWGSETRSLQPASAQSDGQDGYNNSTLAPNSEAIKDETPSKPPATSADAADMIDPSSVPDIDEDIFNEVLTTVSPMYPILPSTKVRMQELLSQCPESVSNAFVLALQAVGQSGGSDVKHASSLLHEWEDSEVPRTRAADIVHAQTLLLLIVDADWRSASTLPFLLSRAVALANNMKLWRFSAAQTLDDLDSDELLCLRIWWSLVMMDRWYAAGTGKPAQIPDSSAVAPAGLEVVVGEICYNFIRLSKLLNRISYVISTLPANAVTADGPMAAILTDYIENYREDLPAHIDAAAYPLVHLGYWHCRLLVTLLTPNATITEVLWPTKELTNLLVAVPDVRSPLINHFVALAVLALSKLVKSDKAHDDAVQLISDVTDQPSGSHWDGVKDKLAALLRPGSSADAASQGLQHLADLATAHQGLPDGDGVPSASLVTGYLDIA